MAQVYPFRAFRYNPALAPFDRVLTQPYDKISPVMQEKYYAADPHNLIPVEKGRAYPGDTPQNNVYTRAAAALEEWVRKSVVTQDPAAAFYAYTQEYTVPGTEERGTRRGFIGAGNWRSIRRASFSGTSIRFPGRRRTAWNFCGTQRCIRASFSCCIRIRSGASMRFWRRPRRTGRLSPNCAMNTASCTGCG